MTELWDILDENGNKTGRLHERGRPLAKGDYSLGVNVWIVNGKGDFLITRRAAARGHKWHTTGGCVVAGDESLAAALKETMEEIGCILDPSSAHLFGRFLLPSLWGEDTGRMFVDVWLFRQEIDIDTLVLQTEEICDVMWADEKLIKQIIDEGIFVNPSEWYPYLNELLEHCSLY